MVHTTLNIFDLIVIVVIGLSALLSFFRGFAREILSLGAWIGASIIALYSFPTVSKWIEPQVKNAAVASGLASIGVFMIALVVISILTGILLKFVKKGSEVGFLDNIVGLVFGVARGILLVSIGYFVMTLVMNEKDYPAWLKESVTQPYVAKSARWVASMTPSYLDNVTGTGDRMPKDVDATETNKALSKQLHTVRDSVTHTLGEAREDAKEKSSSIPSFEELQKRVRDENEGHDAR